MFNKKGWSLIAIASLVFSGCSTQYVKKDSVSDLEAEKEAKDRVSYHINNEAWNPEPTCIIVSPLAANTVNADKVELIRKGIYAHLAPKGYRMASLKDVDYWYANQNQSPVSLDSLSADLDCPYVLHGQVTEFQKGYFAIYSEQSVGAELTLERASDNLVLWQAKHTASLSDGDLPLGPLSIASGIFSAGYNMTDEQTLRAIDDLSRRLMTTLPDAKQSASMGMYTAKQTWRYDMNAWLESVPEEDRKVALEQLLQRHDMTSMQREFAYGRLASLDESSHTKFLWAEDRLSRKDYSGSFALLEQIEADETTNPQYWYYKGRSLSALKRYDESDVSLIKAISRNKGNPDYFVALGHVNAKRGNLDRARAAYLKVVDLEPSNTFALYNLGVIDFNEGDYPQSIDAFLKVGQIYKEAGSLVQLKKILKELEPMKKEMSDNRQKIYESLLSSINEAVDQNQI